MAASTEDTPGGYDVSFVVPLDKEYECPVCLLALRDPVQTPCGHSFCKSCFDQVVKRQHERGDSVVCPVDQQRLSTSEVFKDAKVRRLVLALKVQCTNSPLRRSSRRCTWEGELNYLQDHFNECRYVIVECPRKCGQAIQRYELSRHMQIYCERRLLTCDGCKKEFEKQHMAKHEGSCPKLRIDCTLNCGKKMPRENIESHVSETGDCPNTIIPCVFKDSGCDATIKRHEMDHHLTTAVVQHQIKQQQMIKRLTDENKQLNDQNKQLNQRLRFLNSTHRLLFASSSEKIWSSCGHAMLRFSLREVRQSFHKSCAFLAHHTGYKTVLAIFSDGAVEQETENLYVALIPVPGIRDNELKWPFPFRHTIALIDQQRSGDDIVMTIDPTTFDDEINQLWFGKPHPKAIKLNAEQERLLSKTMFRVPLSEMFVGGEKYVRNDEIVVVVEVDI